MDQEVGTYIEMSVETQHEIMSDRQRGDSGQHGEDSGQRTEAGRREHDGENVGGGRVGCMVVSYKQEFLPPEARLSRPPGGGVNLASTGGHWAPICNESRRY